MSIDWSAFSPWPALAGGALIGLAAALFVLLNGRVAGISGILGGLLQTRRGDVGWRIGFLAGLLGAPLPYSMFATLPALTIDAGTVSLVVAGLLFGVGWGLAGFCPGPALVALGAGQVKAAIFVVAMVAGMALFEVIERVRGRKG